MKHLKRIMAFALSIVMALGFTPVAFAAPGNLTVDPKVTVTGFEDGDTIAAYKFISWGGDGAGWVLASGISGISLSDIYDGLDKAELATLASQTSKMTSVTGTTIKSTETTPATWEMECGSVETAGSYLILVKSGGKVKYVYNPAVVSADFSNNPNNPSAVELLTDDSATIKKQSITVDKVADNPDDYDVQVGDIVPFTVTVTVPQYNTNWTEPYFGVSDDLSAGLTIKAIPTIEGLTAGTDYNIISGGTEGASGFTIQFTENYLKNNASATVEIKYSALVGEAVMDTAQVHEETNKVTLNFSNDPTNKESHDTVNDETHHYTFAIDATRLGQGSTKTNELIKVGVDENGQVIEVYKEGETLPTGVTPLEGAEFTLTGVGANGEGTVELTATSDADGRIFFNNLEDGTYTLKETKAPVGYVKDTSEHTVVIDAKYNEDTTLKSYSITIDDEEISTYTATTDAENVTTYEAPAGGNYSFPIDNTKGAELPSTGGIGTTIFYIVGGVMVVGAVVFLLTKRRMTAE